MKFTRYLTPLYGRTYRLLWIGQTTSAAGGALVLVASVFAVLGVGGTAADVGLVAAASAVARVLFSLVGGVWADRLSRRSVMLAADIIRAIVQGAFAVLLLTGTARVWELALGNAIYGAAAAFFGPASTGLLPEIVQPEQLQLANSLMNSAASFFSVVGPAIAGALVSAFGAGMVFAVDGATFVVSAISLSMLKLPPRSVQRRASFAHDLITGYHEVMIRRWYWISLIAHAFWNFAIPAFFILGPIVAERTLGGAAPWGLISASWAAGAVGGGLIAMRVRPRRPLIAGNLALVLSALPILALAPPLSTWVIAAAAALGGAGVVFLNSLWTTTIQELVPDAVRSRVDSYDLLISFAIYPIGLILVGHAVLRLGFPVTLIAAALILAGPCVLVVAAPAVRAVRRADDGTLRLLPAADVSGSPAAEVSGSLSPVPPNPPTTTQ